MADNSAMTVEQAQAALVAAQAEHAKREAAKAGTSVEHNEQIMQLTPEMQRALTDTVSVALDKVYAKEVETRQKLFGENAAQAKTFVSDAVDMARQKKERAQEESKIIALFLRGVYKKERSMQEEALGLEEKYLGRKTIHSSENKGLKQRAMGAATAGDELVPEIWTNQIIENIERHGLARRLARIIPMATDTVKFPKITSGLTAYEVSAGSAITASDLVTTTITLGARKLATITAFYNELLDDANPSLVPLLTEMAAVALANKEDTLALTGAGSTVSGILESSTNAVVLGGSATSGSTTISDITFDDLALLIDALDSQYIDDGCAFFFNKKVLYHLHALTAAAGYLWAPATAGSPSTIRGFPYYTSSVMSSAPAITTAFAFFGNMKHLYMGDRGVYTVAIGTEGTVGSDNLFEKAMSAVRVTERVEFEIADDEGFAPLKTATS